MSEYEKADRAGTREFTVRAENEPTRPTAIDHLDMELDRLESTINNLGLRLQIVSSSSADVEKMTGEPDSNSPLDHRASRLGRLTGTLDRLIRDLDI